MAYHRPCLWSAMSAFNASRLWIKVPLVTAASMTFRASTLAPVSRAMSQTFSVVGIRLLHYRKTWKNRNREWESPVLKMDDISIGLLKGKGSSAGRRRTRNPRTQRLKDLLWLFPPTQIVRPTHDDNPIIGGILRFRTRSVQATGILSADLGSAHAFDVHVNQCRRKCYLQVIFQVDRIGIVVHAPLGVARC